MNDVQPLVVDQKASATAATIRVIDDQLLMSSAPAHVPQGNGLGAHSLRVAGHKAHRDPFLGDAGATVPARARQGGFWWTIKDRNPAYGWALRRDRRDHPTTHPASSTARRQLELALAPTAIVVPGRERGAVADPPDDRKAEHRGAIRRRPAIVSRPLVAWRSVPPQFHLAGEMIGLLVFTVLAGVGFAVLLPPLGMSVVQTLALVESATSAAAAIVALLCILSSRMGGHPQLLGVGQAWAFYGLAIMPLSSLSIAGLGQTLWSAAAAAAAAVFLVLFVSATRGSEVRWPGGWMLLAVLFLLAAAVLPILSRGLVGLRISNVIILMGWTLLACRCVMRGLRLSESVWWRMGFGLGVIAAGHLLGIANNTGSAVELAALKFPVLRLLGFLLLLTTLGRQFHQLNRERRGREVEQAEKTAVAEVAQAQRSHEIRNALSNLSAVTSLLTLPGTGGPERSEGADNLPPFTDPGSLTEMIGSEFARLNELLETSSASQDSAGAPVDLVLTRLVTLRRVTGSIITLNCPPRLLAAIPASTLAQVVTNLLANCTRHAPGAQIHVSARSTHGVCVIEVSDAGPGLAATQGAATTAGSGLGLALSSQLVADFGGTLNLHDTSRFDSGTTARLCLPLADGVAVPRHLTAVDSAHANHKAAS